MFYSTDVGSGRVWGGLRGQDSGRINTAEDRALSSDSPRFLRMINGVGACASTAGVRVMPLMTRDSLNSSICKDRLRLEMLDSHPNPSSRAGNDTPIIRYRPFSNALGTGEAPTLDFVIHLHVFSKKMRTPDKFRSATTKTAVTSQVDGPTGQPRP